MINIAIFGYDFQHYKTTNLIKDTFIKKHNLKAVFLSPKLIFDSNNQQIGIDHKAKNITSRNFCKKNNVKLYRAFHNDKIKINRIIKTFNINLGIIAGARIIKKDIIDLFSIGIINYHPGKLPECNGLDAIYKSIQKNISPCVTAHLINDKIDEGYKIHEEFFKIKKNDSIENIKKSNEIMQIKINNLVLNKFIKKNIYFKKIKKKKYLKKMSQIEKDKVIAKYFKNWKKNNS